MSICLTERCSESTHHSQHNELTMVCFFVDLRFITVTTFGNEVPPGLIRISFFAVSLRILRRIIQNILHKTSCQTKENVL